MALASLTERVTTQPVGAHVVGLAWLDDVLLAATGDGMVRFIGTDTAPVAAHPDGAILVTARAEARLLTGGDDGRVVAITRDGSMEVVADEGGRWIDALAAGPAGTLAWSAGKRVRSRDAKGRVDTWEAPTTARGLAFAPKGYRLAVAHYNGASLWFPGTTAKPEFLEWKGSHLDATWSPDGRFVVTSMQENALHGWRLSPTSGHMRMSGYSAKPRSMSWSHDGKWLATSGADAAICWPFDSKDGPTGKAPREAGVRPARVTQIAFHPQALVLATGYEDGCILLIRLLDASELLVRTASRDGAISALAWDRKGDTLAFGTTEGTAGRLALPG